MNAHPDLLRAVVLAAIVITPDHSKRQLVSKKQERREKAKEALADRLVIALSQRS
jgi:cell division protein FtsL